MLRSERHESPVCSDAGAARVPTGLYLTFPPMQIIEEITKNTAAAKPTVAYYPDVRVAGKQLKDPTAANLIAEVCKVATMP